LNLSNNPFKHLPAEMISSKVLKTLRIQKCPSLTLKEVLKFAKRQPNLTDLYIDFESPQTKQQVLNTLPNLQLLNGKPVPAIKSVKRTRDKFLDLGFQSRFAQRRSLDIGFQGGTCVTERSTSSRLSKARLSV
jgi:hypothetical protein